MVSPLRNPGRIFGLLLAFAPQLVAQTPTVGPARRGVPAVRKGPAITVSPALDFGAVEVGQASATQQVTITNISGQPVTIDGVVLAGFDPGEFGFSFVPALPFDLGVGLSEPVQVSFIPTGLGEQKASLRVEYGGLPRSAPLSGIGLGPPGDEYRVNAGGFVYSAGGAIEWSEDFGASGGTEQHVPLPVAGTIDQILYRDRRHGAAFGYALPIPNGNYEVTLHFAELQLPFPGQRVFDVSAEGVVEVDDLDLVLVAGFAAAHTRTFIVNVADGQLDLSFLASAGEAIVSAIEVHAIKRLTADTAALAFGAVASGGSAQLVVTLTNDGHLPITIDTLSLLLGDAGTPAAMSVELIGQTYPGVPGDVSHAVGETLALGQVEPMTVTFSPVVEQYDDCILRLAGDFDTVEIGLNGLGGHEGHPFLHVVIDMEDAYVDYDGDGLEDVTLDGSLSHTHEPGQNLIAYEWSEGGGPIASGPVATLSFAEGNHDVTLEITDDGVPPDSLSDNHEFDVVPVSRIPGVLVTYHDAFLVPETPADMVLSPPAEADFVEIVPTTIVGGLTTIGESPYSQDVMVRLQTLISLPTSGLYEFVAGGGAQRVVLLGDLGMVGPVSLLAGLYYIDARFAVDGTGQLPLQILLSVDGGPVSPIDPSWLVHNETDIKPVINTMPTLGTSLGGNNIVIEGIGFFPFDQVVVHWGALQFSQSFFDSIGADEIAFVSPPGAGTISVQVETPAGFSNAVDFVYDQSGPVPINFIDQGAITVTEPTTATWGPDGLLYVGGLDGRITAFEFADDYTVISSTTYDGVSGLTNKDLLGITTNPFDPPSPVRLYLAHGEHFVNGGSTFTGPSPYTGQVSVLEGPLFDTPVPLVTQLPTSNHDHAVNGIAFDHNGDLLICVGSNTNAGVRHPASGDLVESPLSAAIVKAGTSDPAFNGAITYVLTGLGMESTDQVDGEDVDVASDVDVFVQVPGLRNPYDLVYTTKKRLYATDNGPNDGFGAASTGLTTEGPDPQDKDEVLLIEFDNYYGHPNRSRGRYDARQNIYRTGSEPSIPEEFTQTLDLLNSSMDGVDEYRANTLPGPDAR